jgi:hypothetical protein
MILTQGFELGCKADGSMYGHPYPFSGAIFSPVLLLKNQILRRKYCLLYEGQYNREAHSSSRALSPFQSLRTIISVISYAYRRSTTSNSSMLASICSEKQKRPR